MDKKLSLDQELMAENADLQARLQQAEEALYRIQDGRSDNTLWAHLVKLSSQPMAIGFPDGRLGLVNAAFEKLTGYTATELHHMNWTWAALTPPEWLNSEHEQLATLQATGVPVRYEKEYIRKDGSRVPIELLAHLMADEKGKPRFYYAFITGGRRLFTGCLFGGDCLLRRCGNCCDRYLDFVFSSSINSS